jgi:cobalt-zinc-cadmium efflux system outer membrane protein
MGLEKNRLAAMWLGDNNFNHITGKLSQLPKLPDAKQLATIISQQLEQLPDYRYQVALSRLADTRLTLAQANSSADINIGLGLRHNDNTGNQSLVLSAAMPLNFLNSAGNPNRGRITSAQVQQQLSLEQVERKRRELEIELTRIQQNLEKDLRLAKRINKQLLPLASELLSNTQKAYRQGQYTVLQWIDAQDQVFNLEQDLINSQVRIFNQLLELERILGQSIVSAQ